jgi:hypothetical protein
MRAAADRNYREFCIVNNLESQHGVELNYSKSYNVWHVGQFATEFDPSVIHNDKTVSEVVADIIKAL